ncbi:MAG: flippase [Candidatus Thiodiazotropha sp. (ex Dulcina madagascariensis)]|nr:flippase [Candidatus Thiodiazotropha sp. (ex Dulcina madagascariensis)]
MFGLSQFRKEIGSLGGIGSIKALNAMLTYTIALMLSRWMGIEEYGEFAFYIGVINLGMVFAAAGTENFLTREVSASLVIRDTNRIQRLVKYGILAASIGTLIVLSLIGIFDIIPWESGILVKSTPGYLFVLIPLLVLCKIFHGVLRGFGRPTMALVPEVLLYPLLCLIAYYIFFSYMHLNVDSSIALFGNMLAAVLVVIVGVIAVRKTGLRQLKPSPSISELKSWGRSSFFFILVSASNSIFNQIDRIMLGIMRDSSEVGIYAVAITNSNLVEFVTLAVNLSLAGVVSRLNALNDHKQLQAMVKVFARIVFVSSGIIVAILFVFGEWILKLFGSEFRLAYHSMMVLAISKLITAIASMSGLLLTMTGHEKWSAQIAFLACSINVLLNLVLIPRFGATGAAYATLITVIIWRGMMARKVKILTGIDPTPFLLWPKHNQT